MDRIASFAHHRSLVEQALRVQAKFAQGQTQLATGNKSEDFAGIAGDARLVVNLESDLARALSYVDNGEIVKTRVETMYAAVSQIQELTTDARTLISSALSGTGTDPDTLAAQTRSLMEEIAALLNTNQEGRFLFAGARSDAPPVTVDPATYGPIAPGSAADTSYYLGDGTQAAYEAAEGLTVTYGVTANAEGFEQILRALNLANTGAVDPLDTAALQEAFDLAGQAVDGQSLQLTRLSLAAEKTESAIDANLDLQLYAEGLLGDLKHIDVAEATARLTALEAQLESSYATITTLNKLRLLDYL